MIGARCHPARRTRWFLGCALLLASCDAKRSTTRPPDAPDNQPTTLPLGNFPLDTLEPTVRRQLSAAIGDVESNPSDAAAVGRLGMLYHTYGIHHHAQPCYERAVDLAPDETRWRYYLGVILRKNGQPNDAVEQFDVILRTQNDDAPTLSQRAEAHLARSHYEDALADYERVIQIKPTSPQAHRGAGVALLKLNRLDDCEAQLRRALTLAPNYGRARYALALALRARGKVDEAAEHFRLAEAQRDVEPPIDDPLAMELDNLATGAIEALHRGIDRLQAGAVNEALPLLEESLRLNAGLAETHTHLGTALVMAGDLDRAESLLRQALELQPGYAQAHYTLGLIAHRRSEYTEAIDHFNAALVTNPSHFDAHLGLGIDLVKGRQGTEGRRTDAEPGAQATGGRNVTAERSAADHLRAAMRLRPDDPRPYKRLATVLTNQRDYAGTGRVLRLGVEHLPTDLTLANRLAWMLATAPDDGERRPAESVALAESVCRSTNRTVPQALDTLAAAYAAAGRFEEAVATAREALQLARSSGTHQPLTAEIAARLALYESNKPFHLPSVQPGSRAP